MNVKKTQTQISKTLEVETHPDCTMDEFLREVNAYLDDLNENLENDEKWRLALDEDPEVENPYRMWRGNYTFTIERRVY